MRVFLAFKLRRQGSRTLWKRNRRQQIPSSTRNSLRQCPPSRRNSQTRTNRATNNNDDDNNGNDESYCTGSLKLNFISTLSLQFFFFSFSPTIAICYKAKGALFLFAEAVRRSFFVKKSHTHSPVLHHHAHTHINVIDRMHAIYVNLHVCAVCDMYYIFFLYLLLTCKIIKNMPKIKKK